MKDVWVLFRPFLWNFSYTKFEYEICCGIKERLYNVVCLN
jgi:hypothetical protein